MIRCPLCTLLTDEQTEKRRERGQDCPHACAGEFVELPGDAPANCSSPAAYWDALHAADMSLRLLQSERAPMPSDWAAQPARFVLSYDYMRAFMTLDIEEARERRRLDAAIKGK